MKLMKSSSYYAGYENARKGGTAGWTGTASALDEYAEGMRDFHADQRLKDAVLEQDLNECIGNCNTNQQFESLAAKPAAMWSGDTLPPVGAECEWLASGEHDWMRVKILAYHEDEVWLQPLNGGQSFTVGNPDDFRPIRTEAERKREEAIKKIAEMGFFSYDEDLTSAAFLFDAIAAGKIPHIQLEA